MGADMLGTWSGQASLLIGGNDIKTSIATTVTATETTSGTCALRMEIIEASYKLCGYKFEGPLTWEPGAGEWQGMLETSDGGPNNHSTTFDVGASPRIGDRLALSIEIAQSTNELCLDRTIEGNLARAE